VFSRAVRISNGELKVESDGDCSRKSEGFYEVAVEPPPLVPSAGAKT
jgi:hypothetical protein